MARTQSKAMTKALAAIMHPEEDKRLSVPEASKKFGVRVNSIYHKAAYVEWSAKQKEATND